MPPRSWHSCGRLLAPWLILALGLGTQGLSPKGTVPLGSSCRLSATLRVENAERAGLEQELRHILTGLEEPSPPETLALQRPSVSPPPSERTVPARTRTGAALRRFFATTHYTTLGVMVGASHDEIKSAFRALSKRLHPDNPSGDTSRFVRIRKAYDALKTETRRVQYDRRLAARVRAVAPRKIDAAVRILEHYLESTPSVAAVDHLTDQRIILHAPADVAKQLQLSRHFGVGPPEARQLFFLLLIQLNQKIAPLTWRPFSVSNAVPSFTGNAEFDRYRHVVNSGRVPYGFWKTVPLDVQRQFVQLVAIERRKAPHQLRVVDFASPLKAFGGRRLDGLPTRYERQYRVPRRQAVVLMLRDLQLLPEPPPQTGLAATQAALKHFREGFVFWKTVPLEAQRQLVQMAALELGRAPSALRVSDFRTPIAALDHRSLVGLLNHYRRPRDSTRQAVRRLKQALGIPAFTPSGTRLPAGDRAWRAAITELIHTDVKWATIPFDIQRRLVQSLADQLGKDSWELRAHDFDTHLTILNGGTLTGLYGYHGTLRTLRTRLGIAFPWSSDETLATFMRRPRDIRWHDVPPEAQRRIVQIAARELGRPASMLRINDFGRPVQTFGGKSLYGLLWHYRKTAGSYPEAIRHINTRLRLSSEHPEATPGSGVPPVDSTAPSTVGLEEFPVARDRTAELVPPSPLDTGA